MVPGLVLNLILTKVEHRTLELGRWWTLPPLNAASTPSEVDWGKESLSQSVTQIVVALGLVNLVGWAVWRVVERHWAERRTQGGPVG